jgi:hypothetical protein
LGTGLTAGPHLSVSGAKRKGRGGGAGPAGLQSWANWADARARKEKKEKGLWPGCLRAEVGPAGEMRERERGRKGFLFFFSFKFLFKFIFFKHSNFNQTKSMHSNHDAQTLIISKLFW